MRRKTPSTLERDEPRTSVRADSRNSNPSRNRAYVRRRLLNWYDKNKRDLPWRRRETDPYAQWVAEIMLQQTRVETVLRYYEPFLAKFPTFQSLAKARHQDVLKMWEGLGYYRRILHLHRAVQELCGSGLGIPSSAEGLRELSGVGDYTAAAISSIAYGEQVAAVDANVARVVGRLLGLDAVNTATERAEIQDGANELLCKKRPGDFNQAWMDLGSSICLPRNPRCAICPLKSYCVTGNNPGASLSPASSKPKPVECAAAVALLMHKERILVRRRPEGGLWSGLWEFPSMEHAEEKGSSSIRQIAAAHSLVIVDHPRKVGMVRHQLTHKSISFHIFEAELSERPRAGRSTRWVTQEAFERLPVSTAHRRIHRLWLEFRSRRTPAHA